MSGFGFSSYDIEEKLDAAELSSEPAYAQSQAVTASEENTVSQEIVSSKEEATSAKPEESSKPIESSQNTSSAKESEAAKPDPPITVASSASEKRAVWISFLEYQKILKNKTERQFRNSIFHIM